MKRRKRSQLSDLLQATIEARSSLLAFFREDVGRSPLMSAFRDVAGHLTADQLIDLRKKSSQSLELNLKERPGDPIIIWHGLGNDLHAKNQGKLMIAHSLISKSDTALPMPDHQFVDLVQHALSYDIAGYEHNKKNILRFMGQRAGADNPVITTLNARIANDVPRVVETSRRVMDFFRGDFDAAVAEGQKKLSSLPTLEGVEYFRELDEGIWEPTLSSRTRPKRQAKKPAPDQA